MTSDSLASLQVVSVPPHAQQRHTVPKRRISPLILVQLELAAPFSEIAKQWNQFPALGRECVFRTRRVLAIEAALDDSLLLESLQSLGEEIGGDTVK